MTERPALSAQDLARLELAARAYRATLPSESEQQAAVRRLRLRLRRNSQRRVWPARLVVLAILGAGSLAYAKPGALQGWFQWAAAHLSASEHRMAASRPSRAASTTPEQHALERSALAPSALAPSALERSALAPSALAPSALAPAARAHAASASSAHAGASAHAKLAEPLASVHGASRLQNESKHAPAFEHAQAQRKALIPQTSQPLSSWGRVGAALARNDSQAALGALHQLSRSSDPRTRDKADLGRAQLHLASGNLAVACRITRELLARNPEALVATEAENIRRDCAP